MKELVIKMDVTAAIFILLLSLELSSGVLAARNVITTEYANCDVKGTDYECIGYDFVKTTASLPPNTTAYKYIAQESIVDLNEVDFSHLALLEELQLSTTFECRLEIRIGEVTRDYIFGPLVRLKVLSLNIQWWMSDPLPGLFAPLYKLEILDLSDTRRLDISNMLQSFEGLRNKSRLWKVNLWNIQNLEYAQDFMFLNLSVMLEPMKDSPLTHLNLGYNGFRTMFPGLIEYTPLLESLVLSNNILMPLVTSSLFLEIIMHPSLRTVHMGEQGFRPADVMLSPGPIKTCNASASSSSSSDQTAHRHKASSSRFVHPALVRQPPPPHDYINRETLQKTFSRKGNLPDTAAGAGAAAAAQASRLGVGIAGKNKCFVFHPDYAYYLDLFTQHHDQFCEYLYKFEYETFGGILCHGIPRIRDMVHPNCTGCTVTPLGPNFQAIDLSQLNIYDEVEIFPDYQRGTQCFHPKNNLLTLDLSKNNDYGFIGISHLVQTEVKGLEKLQEFDVSESGLTALNPFLFQNFPDLKILNMAQNHLTFTENYTQDLFVNNTKLEILDVSNNKIKRFFAEQFSSLSRLQVLDVSNNQLEEFDIDISAMRNLRFIDLSSNALHGFNEAFTDQLTALADRGQKITLDLSDNDLACICSNQDFTKWLVAEKHTNILLENFEASTCVDKNSNRVLLQNFDISDFKSDCNKLRDVIIGSILGTIAFCALIVGGVVAYLKRWRIRYYIYVAQQSWRRKRRVDADYKSYQYDAFISYNQEDRFWVHDILRPKLEDEQGLKICLHFRDFLVGDFIADQIIEAIESSRKTILILSPNFLRSNWCQFEMQMARNRLFDQGTDVLILALLKPLPRVGVTSTLARLMETKVYIEWKYDDDDAQKLFWTKLMAAVKGPVDMPFEA